MIFECQLQETLEYMLNFKPLSRTLADPSLIYEFADPLPAWAVKSGEKYFDKFSFEYGHHAASLDDGEPYFGKMLFLREENLNLSSPPLVQNLCDCLQLSILPQIDPNGKFIELQRISVNGQTHTQNPCAHIDTDTDINLWTAVYYVNNSSGDTIFYKSMSNIEEVHCSKFQQGKLVIFPASFCHRACAPKLGWRISIGITFEWHTELSKLCKRDI
jgi:hypothetical protein